MNICTLIIPKIFTSDSLDDFTLNESENFWLIGYLDSIIEPEILPNNNRVENNYNLKTFYLEIKDEEGVEYMIEIFYDNDGEIIRIKTDNYNGYGRVYEID